MFYKDSDIRGYIFSFTTPPVDYEDDLIKLKQRVINETNYIINEKEDLKRRLSDSRVTKARERVTISRLAMGYISAAKDRRARFLKQYKSYWKWNKFW